MGAGKEVPTQPLWERCGQKWLPKGAREKERANIPPRGRGCTLRSKWEGPAAGGKRPRGISGEFNQGPFELGQRWGGGGRREAEQQETMAT